MPSAPTTEQGAIQQGIGGWTSLVDEIEHAPNLIWPNNLAIYRQMKTDAQVEALYRGTTLPIRRYNYSLDPNGASEQAVTELSEDLNIPIRGEEARRVGRRKGRFSFKEHTKWALESILWGHYFFEQVGAMIPGGPAGTRWQLKKLAPRPPRIIEDIKTERDGGLKSIVVPAASDTGFGSVEIGVDRLVAYVWDQEPGQWTGMSMLRSIYKNWLLKDRLIRIDLIKHDRAGAGMPTATGAPGMSRPQLEALARMAQEFKVDEQGGGALPHGADLELKGISGTVPDTWASIRGHNEEMARAWMMQVIQLGQTETGSRALGETHLSALHESQDTIAGSFCDTFNEHVIEDWIDWNYGEDEPAPQLVYDRPDDGSFAIADLATMVDKNLIEVDEELETWLRQNFRMPEKGTARTPAAPDDGGESSPGAPTIEAGRRDSRSLKAAGKESPSPSLPDRELRRKPYTHEIQAAVDWDQMERDFVTMSEGLRDRLIAAQADQIDELAEAIRAAGNDPVKLAAIEVTPLGQDAIEEVMEAAAKAGEAGARSEAVAQGVSNAKGAKYDAEAIRERAEATSRLLSRSLAEAGSREAVRRAGTATADDLADAVKTYLGGLTGAHVEKQARGLVTKGINLGRTGFMRENNPARIYASELMDSATCQFCVAIDGTEFESMDEAMSWYPGGFVDCQGGDNCRGTLVGVYADEATPTLER